MKRLLVGGLFLFLVSIAIINLKNAKQPGKNPSNIRYQRVVALAPSMSETLIALKEEHRLLGVSTHCQSPEVNHLPKVGSFTEPNFEAIIALDPDLVLAIPHPIAKQVIEMLKAEGIEVFAHQPDSLKDIKFINTALAEMFGQKDKGLVLNQQLDAALDKAQRKAIHKGKAVLIAISPSPFVVAGKATFASEIVEAMGFINMASDKKMPWPIWPLEKLLHSPPSYLILANGEDQAHQFEKTFNALGLNLKSSDIRIIIPKRPIFMSPSPKLIEDAGYLGSLLEESV